MGLRTIIARHPLAFAVATLVACLAVYSGVAAANPPSLFIPPAVASIPAFAAYRLSRPVFWAGATHKRDARVLAAASVGAALVVAALGIGMGAFEPHATDIPLITGQGAGLSPALSLLAIAAVCAFTGIYEEAVFSAVLFGALRVYYARDGNEAADNPPSEDAPIRALSRRMFGKAAAVQGLVFAFAHIVTGLLAASQGVDAAALGQMAVWFVATFLFGVVTAVLMEYGHSLALNAAVHALYDFALFGPLALKAGTMRAATITGDVADLALFAAQAGILAVVLVILYAIAKRRG